MLAAGFRALHTVARRTAPTLRKETKKAPLVYGVAETAIGLTAGRVQSDIPVGPPAVVHFSSAATIRPGIGQYQPRSKGNEFRVEISTHILDLAKGELAHPPSDSAPLRVLDLETSRGAVKVFAVEKSQQNI